MRAPLAVRSIVAVLTVWALLSIAPDLARPFAPFGTTGLGVDFDGRIVAVAAGSTAAQANIRPATPTAAGDRINFARTPPDSLFMLYGGLGGRPFFPVGSHIELGLIAPDGSLRTVSLEAAERDPPISERVSLFVSGLVGIGFIALGAFLAWYFPLRRDVLGFFLFAIWFNPGQDYVYYALLPRAARVPQEVLSALAQATGIAGFVTFALRFPTDRSEGWRGPVERALPVFVIALTGLTLAGSGAEFGHPSGQLWLTAFWVKVAIYPLIVAAFLTKLQLLPPVERQRLRIVILGCIPGLFFFLLAESVEATGLWQPLFDRIGWTPSDALLNCFYLVNALVPISIGYAVLRQRVLPIHFIVNRGLTLGIVWVIVGMSAEAIVLTTHAFLAENHIVSTLILAAAIVAVAPLLERLKEVLNAGVDRFLFVRLHSASRDLEQIARDLALSTSSSQIEAAIVTEPCTKLELAAAALFVLADDGSYQLTAQHDWPPTALQAIEPGDPLIPHSSSVPLGTRARDAMNARSDLPAGVARPALILTLAPNAYVEALAIFSGHTDGTTVSPDEAAVLIRFVRECGAVRAHVQALAMRRELARLHQADATRRATDGTRPALSSPTTNPGA